ncbi:MAG: hypothetical protein N4A70_11145 [Pelagimonas sp.]|nr:hypothetical protein [Pelagimonas sp.]
MKRFALGLVAALGFATGAQAATVGYLCDMKNSGKRSWIAQEIFFAHNQKTDEIIVSDVVILSFNNKKPMVAEKVKENAKRLTFKWRVDGVSSSGQRAKLFYRGTYVKATKKLSVSMSPGGGYEGRFNQLGSCKASALKK